MPVAKRKRASSSLESTRVWNQLKQCLLQFISLPPSPTALSLSVYLSLSDIRCSFVCLLCLVLGQVQGAFATRCQLHDAVAEAYTYQGCQAAAGWQCTAHKAQTNGKLTHPLATIVTVVVHSKTQLAINFIASCRNVSIHSISPRWASAPAAAPACTWSPAWWPNGWPDLEWLLVLL